MVNISINASQETRPTCEEGGVWVLGVHQDTDLRDPQAEDGVVHPELAGDWCSLRFKFYVLRVKSTRCEI